MNVSTALPVARRHAGHAAVRGLHSISNILTRTFHHPHRTRHSGTFLYIITCREGTNITTLQTLIITTNHITNITNGLFVRLIVRLFTLDTARCDN